MTFSYNLNIPAAANNPSQDQPNMFTNTNSIASLIAVDHFGFNVSNGGTHKQVQMPVQAGVPSGLFSGEGTIYTNADSATLSQLFYSNDASGDDYQLTRAIHASFASFGIANNGWTFLPGGLLFQYGAVNVTTGSSSTITLPVAFQSTGYIVTTGIQTSGTVVLSSFNVGNFKIDINTSGTVTRLVYWMALGL